MQRATSCIKTYVKLLHIFHTNIPNKRPILTESLFKAKVGGFGFMDAVYLHRSIGEELTSGAMIRPNSGQRCFWE